MSAPPIDYEECYEHAPCGYLTTRTDGIILHCNRTLLEWTGYALTEIAGTKTLQDLLTIGGKIFYETHYAPLLALQNEAREIALDLAVRDGRVRPVLVTTHRRDTLRGPVFQSSLFDSSDRRKYERELAKKNAELRQAMEEIKTLRNFIPICSECRKVRTDQDAWIGLEAYLQAHTDAQFSHGYCPTCAAEFLRKLDQMNQSQGLPPPGGS